MNYHERTDHISDSTKNVLRKIFDAVIEFLTPRNQVINTEKSTIMLFNFSQTLDFQPKLLIGDHALEVVKHTKVLGLTLSENLKWDLHISNVTQKARGRINVIQKLKLTDLTLNLFSRFISRKFALFCNMGQFCSTTPPWHLNYLTRSKNFNV